MDAEPPKRSSALSVGHSESPNVEISDFGII